MTVAVETIRAAEPAPTRAPRRIPAWLAIVAASLPMFMATLDNLVMTTALPVVRADLGASVGELSWFVNAYTLSFATFMLPAATLGDRMGRRRVMIGGVVVFTLASIAAALSTSAEALIAARAVQGLGAAAIMPLSLSLLASAVPANKRAVAIGIWGGVSGLGVALGPVIGGAVVDGVSWQAIFWLNVPVAIVALPLLVIAVRESRGTWKRLDPIGTLLLGGAVFLGIWGIVHGNDDGWTSTGVIVPLVVSALLLPAYVVWARGRDHAVLPLRLFSSRGFSVRQRDRPDVHDRDVRHGVPALAVPPGRAALLAVRGRGAHVAVDRGTDGGRTTGRRALVAHRAARAAARRAGPADRVAGVVRRPHRVRPPATRRSSRRWRWPASAWA